MPPHFQANVDGADVVEMKECFVFVDVECVLLGSSQKSYSWKLERNQQGKMSALKVLLHTKYYR